MALKGIKWFEIMNAKPIVLYFHAIYLMCWLQDRQLSGVDDPAMTYLQFCNKNVKFQCHVKSTTLNCRN